MIGNVKKRTFTETVQKGLEAGQVTENRNCKQNADTANTTR